MTIKLYDIVQKKYIDFTELSVNEGLITGYKPKKLTAEDPKPIFRTIGGIRVEVWDV